MLLKLKNVSKFYYNKGVIATGFNKVNLDLDLGEFVVITGESGSGKSTLLNVISGLDSYEEGEMYINGEETSHYREIDFENYRKKYVSNIFQNYNLVNSYTVKENIELVLLLNGYKKKNIKDKVNNLIKEVGLEKYKNTKAAKLSGGQKQRVAIARALAKETPIIVCDEPTGNLDSKAAKDIIRILKEVSKDKLVVLVTHDYPLVESYATRVINMNDGKVLSDKKITDTVKQDNIEISTPKEISFLNIIRLGIRNTFNIIPKFLLLLAVFLFVSSSLLLEYASSKSSEYEESITGSNSFFTDTSDTRIVITKKDKSLFKEEDIISLKNNINISKVIENDYVMDNYYCISDTNNEMWYCGNIKSSTEFNGELDYGRMPTSDDEIILLVNGYDYYIEEDIESIYKTNFYVESNNVSNLKVVGIKYNSGSYEDGTIYLSDSILNKMSYNILKNKSTKNIKINNNIISDYEIVASSKLSEGYAYVPESLVDNCKDFICKNNNLNITVNNVFYNESLNIKIKDSYTDKTSKKLLGINSKNSNYGSIFISEIDYNNLFNKGTYQVSVYATNKDTVDILNEELNTLGYKTLKVRDTIVNYNEEILKILEIAELVGMITLIVALFFISYFVIKLILKSRNIYWSTLRILGSSYKNIKRILDVELITNASLSYILVVTFINVFNKYLINTKYNDIVTYLKPINYFLVYLILIFISYLISNRFSRKIFKNSAMHTYREEV